MASYNTQSSQLTLRGTARTLDEIRKEKEMREKITDTMIIGFVTIFSYITYYVMSVGYYSYLNIPLTLISIEFTNVIGTLASLLLIFLFIIFLLEGVISLIPLPKDIVYQNIIKRYLVSILIGILIIVFIGFEKNYIVAYLFVMLISSIIDFFSPIIFERKIKGYKNKLYSSLSKDNHKEKTTLDKNKISLVSFIRRIDKDLPKVFTLIFLILISSMAFGNFSAKNKTSFTVLSYDDENYLIYGTYEGKYITRKVDDENKIIDGNVYLIEIDNKSFFKIIKEN